LQESGLQDSLDKLGFALAGLLFFFD